ncbi:hypothetical protein BKA56DRAFT_349522 [Ilyonectria sp. MPI-CAGE-AT-0026]|nr:hypothetical protein BKA56DRAFT_349522 [Ilyonectria sp. MPI-CAGE-AT-0026]
MADPGPNHALDSESRVASIIALSAATCAIAVASVAMRLYSRACISKWVGIDDWCILAAGFFVIGTSFTVPYRTRYGLGRHTWMAEDWMTVPHMKVFYASIILYNGALISVKISFLFFYRRVFPNPGLYRLCFWFLIGMGIWGATAIALNIVPCIPVNGFWDFSVHASCIPSIVDWYLQSLLMIVTDFAILALPLPAVWKLNAPRRQKIVMLGCFSVGFLTCLISILRLYSLKIAANTTDPNWDYVDAAMWSVAEVNVAVFCACLPTLKPLLSGCSRRFTNYSKGWRTHADMTRDHSNDTDEIRVVGDEGSRDVLGTFELHAKD